MNSVWQEWERYATQGNCMCMKYFPVLSQTIGDQIGSRKATSDLNVLLTTYKATVICESSHGMTNDLSLNADFFNPNKSPFEDEEVIVSIFIPFLLEVWNFIPISILYERLNSLQNTVISSFREPIKKAMGSAILSAGLRVTLEKDSNQIIDSTFVFGGSSLDQTSIATLTSAHIAGRWASSDTINFYIPYFT